MRWSPYATDDPTALTSDALTTLYEDEHLLAISKPAGLLVHRGWGKDAVTLVDLVRARQGAKRAVYTIHRLDRATSGVILFAHTAQAARALGALFMTRQITKRYLMMTRGHAPAQGLIDRPLPRREDGPRVPAYTAYRCLHHTQDTQPRGASVIEAIPLTGRPHQLRRHLAHINHPLLGDSRYGKASLNQGFRENYGLARLALHAASLRLPHPVTGEPLHLVAPLADDLAQAWHKMGVPPSVWEDAPLTSDAWAQALGPSQLESDDGVDPLEDDAASDLSRDQ